MGRREWFIDHNEDGWNAAVSEPEPKYDRRVGFLIRADEDQATEWIDLEAEDAIKLGKALVKAGKKAKEAWRVGR